ncbi:MAG TPA: hypothetical protein PK313_07145, partial [Myxococcota bacterium]|nr:hypothetical protein [Myxococcota bacterium]
MSEGFQEDLLFGSGVNAPASAASKPASPVQAQSVSQAVAPVAPVTPPPAVDVAADVSAPVAPVAVAPAPVTPPPAKPAEAPRAEARPRIPFERRYTEAGRDVFDSVEWEKRDAVIKGEGGRDVGSTVDMPSYRR